MKSKLFKYGSVVWDDWFTCREKLLEQLDASIESNQTSVIYGSRRVGKSSLIFEAIRRYKKKHGKAKEIIFDLSKTVNSTELLTMMCKKIAEIIDEEKSLKQNLKKLTDIITSVKLKVSFNVLSGEVEPGLEFKGKSKDIPETVSEVLAILKKIGSKKKIILVFDEFQSVAKWHDGDQIQWQIRSELQYQENICYIFSGSSRKLIEKIFLRSQSALYRCGRMLYVNHSLELDCLKPWLEKRFRLASMTLTPDAYKMIFDIARRKPYYTQKLCYYIWSSNRDRKGKKILDTHEVSIAVQQVVEDENIIFREKLEQLSFNQQNCLKAIANLTQSQSNHELKDIHRLAMLGSKTSTNSAIKSLESGEEQIIQKFDGEYFIDDPFFELWLLA